MATNLTERIGEARDRTWIGEVEGINQTLVVVGAKTAQPERLARTGITDTPESLA